MEKEPLIKKTCPLKKIRARSIDVHGLKERFKEISNGFSSLLTKTMKPNSEESHILHARLLHIKFIELLESRSFLEEIKKIIQEGGDPLSQNFTEYHKKIMNKIRESLKSFIKVNHTNVEYLSSINSQNTTLTYQNLERKILEGFGTAINTTYHLSEVFHDLSDDGNNSYEAIRYLSNVLSTFPLVAFISVDRELRGDSLSSLISIFSIVEDKPPYETSLFTLNENNHLRTKEDFTIGQLDSHLVSNAGKDVTRCPANYVGTKNHPNVTNFMVAEMCKKIDEYR